MNFDSILYKEPLSLDVALYKQEPQDHAECQKVDDAQDEPGHRPDQGFRQDIE